TGYRCRSEVDRPVGVAQVAVAHRAGPLEGAGADHPVTPVGVGLRAMVLGAELGDVVAGGRSAALPGNDVVVLAGPCWSGAPREHAGPVPQGDLFGESGRWGVGAAGDRLVEVDDGADGDVGAGDAEPLLDRVRRDGPSLSVLD